MSKKKQTKHKDAEFIEDHVFFLNGTKRAVCAAQMKKAKKKFSLPVRMWDAFAIKGIIKATKAEKEAAKKRQAKNV